MIHSTRSAKEQFDRQAAHYNAQWNSWSEETLHWMRARADCRPADCVLDIATGTGFTALAFAPLVGSVVGLDVSPGMLEQARQRAAEQNLTNVTFQEGSAEQIPFPDAAFDLVTCRIAPHHFVSIPDFLRETARVLKPNGRFLLVDTCVPDPLTEEEREAGEWQNAAEALRDPSHVRNYTPQEWRRFIEAAGLKIDSLEAAASIAITLRDWIRKAGCEPEQADAVRHSFEYAPASAVRAFQIQSLLDDDTSFVWQRVACSAVKAPSSPCESGTPPQPSPS